MIHFELDFIQLKTAGVFEFIKDFYKNKELCFSVQLMNFIEYFF